MLWCWKGEVGGALMFQNTLPKVPGSGVTILQPPLDQALHVWYPCSCLWCNPFCRYVTLTAEGATASELRLDMWNLWSLHFNHLAAQNRLHHHVLNLFLHFKMAGPLSSKRLLQSQFFFGPAFVLERNHKSTVIFQIHLFHKEGTPNFKLFLNMRGQL